jgi:uncharacterized protein (TIGR02284 family)
MDKNDVISVLNDLIETSKDGEKGFLACAEGVKMTALKMMFEEAARRCAHGATELAAKVRALGGDPERGGSATGALHRGWVNVKSTVTGMDEAAILAECERGEDAAKRSYEAALKKDLPMDVRTIVERQYNGVKQNHDRVRELRNAAARA